MAKLRETSALWRGSLSLSISFVRTLGLTVGMKALTGAHEAQLYRAAGLAHGSAPLLLLAPSFPCLWSMEKQESLLAPLAHIVKAERLSV